jgi:tetratricopeptide (TPR) repeat protein
MAEGDPDPAVRDARIAATYLVEGDFKTARQYFETSLKAKRDLFEAHYSLGLLEQDAGNATSALEHANIAIETAPDAAARNAARMIVSGVARFAPRSAGATAEGRRENPEDLPARLP